jgi:2-polyprenyl-3-methyl-5-hydroxy-6-metoxy-1,4-benzoquinol methylase
VTAPEERQVDWETARAANLANWNDRVPLHEDGYGLAAFDEPTHLSDVVRQDLPALERHLPGESLAGLDLCHLQCHIGTDTVSLARAGARVTGVDFSEPALAAAARLADRLHVSARWVHTDVLDAAAAVGDWFDVVYTSIGTIGWLQDLDRWAAQIAALLRPGGVFFIRDGHPFLFTLDEDAGDLRVAYRYFPDGRAQGWDDEGTYVGDGRVEHQRTWEFPHSLAEIVTAVLGAGLEIVAFDEGDTLPWQYSPMMLAEGDDWVWPGDARDRVPCTFTLVARRRV